MIAKRKFNLQAGPYFKNPHEKAELCIIGHGDQAYLWIGDRVCYATISGKKTLESLADNIKKALHKRSAR